MNDEEKTMLIAEVKRESKKIDLIELQRKALKLVAKNTE